MSCSSCSRFSLNSLCSACSCKKEYISSWAAPTVHTSLSALCAVLWIRIRKSIRSDPKLLLAGSGSRKNHSGSRPGQLRILNEFVEKLLWKTDTIWQFLNTNTQSENINSFYKIISLKSLYLVIICNLKHLLDGNTKAKFRYRCIRILEKFM